jgi:DTW domain-containing protein YfiP
MAVPSRTRVVLIQHLLEQTERSNTGRHAVGLLERLELRVFGVKDAPLKVDDLSGAWLLWPGEPPPDQGTPLPETVVVLDGSWSQARKMMQRVPELRALRKFSLVAPEGRRSLRAAPSGGMSTLEAIAEVLAVLEGDAVAAPVRAAHEALVQKQLAERGYVGPHSG